MRKQRVCGGHVMCIIVRFLFLYDFKLRSFVFAPHLVQSSLVSVTVVLPGQDKLLGDHTVYHSMRIYDTQCGHRKLQQFNLAVGKESQRSFDLRTSNLTPAHFCRIPLLSHHYRWMKIRTGEWCSETVSCRALLLTMANAGRDAFRGFWDNRGGECVVPHP
jgi:hypothetical protein